MKPISLTLLSLLIVTGSIFSQEQKVSSEIKSVIIYLEGAQIERSKKIDLRSGTNKIIFTGLSPKLDARSIQVRTDDDVQLLSVSAETNFEKSKPETKRVQRLRDSIALLDNKLQELRDEVDAFNIEKQMILRNQSLASTQTGVSVSELKLASDFFRSRTLEINKKMTERNEKITALQITRSKKANQLTELTGSTTTSTKEVIVLLKSGTSQSANVNLKYLVSSAGWAPSYDLRAEDISKPVNLVYRAKVFNNSNIDWNNVNMKLSTADPRLSAAKPFLTTWKISRYSGNRGSAGQYQQSYGGAPPSSGGAVVSRDGVEYEEIDLPELVSEFEIKDRYDIPADAKPYIVDVTNHNLDATYKHFAIPKIEQAVFLLARITGWEDLNLVEGPANVYYGGAYIGQSYIKTSGTHDTLDLSLGRDSKVAISRKKKKDYTSSQLIGGNKKDVLWFDISVKNNRKAPIDIEIHDQIPISGDNSITINALETSNAAQDEESGLLKWNYHIEPGETKSHELKFSIRYPKTMSVSTQRHYKKVRAKF